MGQNLKELKAIVKLCKEAGILYFRSESCELRFSKLAIDLPKPIIKDPNGRPVISGVPSPEQMLAWSSMPHLG